MEQEAKIKRKRYEELDKKNERRIELSTTEIDQLEREMGQIELWMRDKMNERWTMGGWVLDIDDNPKFTNTTSLPCQGNCRTFGLVELHSESNSDNSKLVVKKDCYHQGGNSYTCANCQEGKKPNKTPNPQQQAEIEQLKARIRELEVIINRTPQQEQELQSKKQELAQLEKQQQEPTNWTPWIIGGSIIGGCLLLGLIVYFLTRKRER